MNLTGPPFVMCQARYSGLLLLPVILDHALETICGEFRIICEVDPGSCVKRYYIYFFFLSWPRYPPPILSKSGLCNIKDWRKENFIKIWSSFKEHRKKSLKIVQTTECQSIIGSWTKSFRQEFITKVKKTIKEKHLASCEVGQRILACWDPFFLMHSIVSAISRLWVLSGLSYLLCKVVIPTFMGCPDDVRSFPFWGEFGGPR